MVCAEGWGAVNMSRIADEVVISRPVLYKEFGPKRSLGEALVTRETETFLGGVVARLHAHPDDPVAGLSAATEFAVRSSQDNTLITAILAGGHGADAELLPLLTTDPQPVLARAVALLGAAVRAQYILPALDDAELESTIEIVVRITLSYMLQPLGPPDRGAAQIRRVIAGLFDTAGASL